MILPPARIILPCAAWSGAGASELLKGANKMFTSVRTVQIVSPLSLKGASDLLASAYNSRAPARKFRALANELLATAKSILRGGKMMR
jgi:hypothetical protein